jgi:hypothetical protein
MLKNLNCIVSYTWRQINLQQFDMVEQYRSTGVLSKPAPQNGMIASPPPPTQKLALLYYSHSYEIPYYQNAIGRYIAYRHYICLCMFQFNIFLLGYFAFWEYYAKLQSHFTIGASYIHKEFPETCTASVNLHAKIQQR